MMKNMVSVGIIALLMVACTGRKQTAAPFDLPNGVVYESRDDIEFQSFRWGTNRSMALFMMSPHPAGLSQAMVDNMARQTSIQLEPELRKMEGVATLKKETSEMSAGEFTGKEILFKVGMTDGHTTYASVYILWDGTRLWQGQLTGTQEKDLAMVRAILEAKRKNKRTTPRTVPRTLAGSRRHLDRFLRT